MKGTLGATWGLSPRVTHWFYTAVVQPMVLYGSLVWWTCTTKQWCRAKLNHIQRLACFAITGAFKTTPTAARETALQLPPLHIIAEGEAGRASMRLRCAGQWQRSSDRRGHGRIWAHLRNQDEVFQMCSDNMQVRYVFDHKYKVEVPSRDEWASNKTALLHSKELIWFTDGDGSILSQLYRVIIIIP
ncbi:hypothetical protein NQ317_016407 [Molorchus minor]|uniref:Uncharacterized protein n=1 Tax=Molorchus minor TaxID=1323400 RepID=A0ABQ9J8Q4_9CUCU|nr:hypothetical protein NQ317_016407 [Molorchus minor]